MQKFLKLFIIISVLMYGSVTANAIDNANIKASVIGYGHYIKPNLAPLPNRTYRILVGKDYPPFNFKNEAGKLTGFNIDIARALCLELNLACQIIAKNWKAIKFDLLNDQADFAVASLAISQQNLNQFEMSQKYYDTPARFIVRQNSDFDASNLSDLRHKNIAVVSGTGHEAYMLEYFSEANISSFPNLNLALASLLDGKVMTVFADAITSRNWLNGEISQNCCNFANGDFYEARFFGQGAAMALPKGNMNMRDWLNKALSNLWATGRYEEIFNSYFGSKS